MRTMAATNETRKRKASQENGARSGKRARIEPAPIVLDEFETEAQREVEANAGLTGADVTAGQKISLSHQVGPLLFFHVAVIEISIFFRFAIK